MTDKAERLLYAVVPNGDETMTIFIGVTKDAYDELEGHAAKDVDLTRVGIPVKVCVFGCENRADGTAFIDSLLKKLGLKAHNVGPETEGSTH